MDVSVSPGIEELNPVCIDEVLVVLCARLFVVPGPCTLSALDVNPRAFVQVFADDLCKPRKGLYGEPLRVFLQSSAPVCPPFGGCNGELRDCRTLLAVLLYFTS